ncbi:hypothetical protein N9R04_03895 [Staphylococcus sp. SQ8-PEA]|uniref:Fungal lipase-like domain-containing protein n=1 Tax=Staphylococcus marylandisciuri TaxID=2981529 RepID=A0ABT2QPG1_9STAP|nr:hypothetical protein [Staphylococcus marylandisciuri]MCU5745864.1 hypothetical protein [Staphylococcus marylandisciuri]
MDNLNTKDSTFHELAGNVYDLLLPDKEAEITTDNGSQKIFKIQSSRIDKVNGFQAMAVSPKDSNGNVDNETVYFVYAGTNPYELADINTDIDLATNTIRIETNPDKILNAAVYQDTSLKEINQWTIADNAWLEMLDKNNACLEMLDKNNACLEMLDKNNAWLEMIDQNNAKEADQFSEAYLWTQSVLKKGNYKHVYGAGHSLGGTIAQAMTVLFNFDKTKTFSAPNGYNVLPDNVKENLDLSKYIQTITDYAHPNDQIGTATLGSPLLGTEILADDSKLMKFFFNPISGHKLNTYDFSGADVKIKVDSKKANEMAEEMRDKLYNIDKTVNALEKYMENTKRQARQIESKYVNKLLSGSHEFIHPSDIEHYVEELSKSGRYDFFDEALFEDTIGELIYTKQRLSQFSEKIIDATKKFEERDKEISEIYRWFEEG